MHCTPPGVESSIVVHYHSTVKTMLSQWLNNSTALNTRTGVQSCDEREHGVSSKYEALFKEDCTVIMVNLVVCWLVVELAPRELRDIT